MIISANTYGQKDCSSAALLQDEDTITQIWNTDVFWVNALSYSDTMIYIFSTNNNPNAFIELINLYIGNCGGLELINTYNYENPDSLKVI